MAASNEIHSLNVAILTISDTRSLSEDGSGDYLAGAIREAGHTLIDRCLIPDDLYRVRAVVAQWIAESRVQVVLTTGGTGFSGRDVTPEALGCLFDKTVDGFGELFRHLSHGEIGTSTLQSRALAGLANGTLVFCLPGSTGACRTGWEGILREQLDSRHRPCNFASLLNAGGPKPQGAA